MRFPRPRVAAHLVALVALGSVGASAAAQSEEYKLDSTDRWAKAREIEPGSEEAQLIEARRALAIGDPARAKLLANRFLEAHPLSLLRSDALLLRGDAKMALDDEYEALFDYEEIARKYPGSEVFVTALEREYDIAKEYAAGKRRKFFGTFRIVSTYDDAQELLIRIQERLPGSELAEKAGMSLADFYFGNRELAMAADAYDLFVQNYPRSPQLTKARLRLIYSYLAAFKGPEYDGTGLFEAKRRLRDLQVTEPALAQEVGADAILVRVYESEASKLLSTADWYWRADDAISAELFIRRLVKQYPDSVACLDALRVIPMVLKKLPKSVIEGGPDYPAIRAAKLHVPWDEIPAPTPTPTPGQAIEAGEGAAAAKSGANAGSGATP
ncbi:MAG: outer membrane protein assembly factor BamD [Phycisphaerales bacterium]